MRSRTIGAVRAPPVVDDREPGRFYDVGIDDTASDAPAVFQLERIDNSTFRVMRKFDYVDKLGRWYRVPHDTESNATDLASIPGFLTWLVPRDGSHTPAAILHDAFIGGKVGVHYDTSDGAQVDDRHADYLFREAMERSGVSLLRRWLMWAAVALRTLTVTTRKSPTMGETVIHHRVRIGLIGIAVAVWAGLAAAMALDVPDIVRSDPTQWDLALSWLDDRPIYSEVMNALAMVAVGTAVLAAWFGAVLRSARGVGAGVLGGLMVGFLGLPMLASLVGAAGYWVVDRGVTLVARAVDGRSSGPRSS